MQVIPRNIKLDIERPEYHRTIAVQDSQTGKVFAFSTGSQMSSRLLSAKSANSFVILPKATAEAPVYHCSGQTKCLIFGPIVNKSPKEIQELIDTNEGQSFKPSCPCCVSKTEEKKTEQTIPSQVKPATTI